MRKRGRGVDRTFPEPAPDVRPRQPPAGRHLPPGGHCRPGSTTRPAAGAATHRMAPPGVRQPAPTGGVGFAGPAPGSRGGGSSEPRPAGATRSDPVDRAALRRGRDAQCRSRSRGRWPAPASWVGAPPARPGARPAAGARAPVGGGGTRNGRGGGHRWCAAARRGRSGSGGSRSGPGEPVGGRFGAAVDGVGGADARRRPAAGPDPGGPGRPGERRGGVDAGAGRSRVRLAVHRLRNGADRGLTAGPPGAVRPVDGSGSVGSPAAPDLGRASLRRGQPASVANTMMFDS